MNCKAVLIAFIIIVLSFSVSASVFTVNLNSVKNDIYPDEAATYNLTISNGGNVRDNYQVYSSEVGWSLETEPLLSPLEPNQTETVTLKLIPNAWATFGPQRIKVNVKSLSSGERTVSEIPVYIRAWEPLRRDYVPSVELVVKIPERIDPRNNIPVEVSLRNRNRLDIPDMKIEFNSKLFTRVDNFSLSPLDEKTQEYIFKVDDLTPPQDDTLAVTLFFNNESINQVKKHISIVPYSDMPVERDINEEFFKRVEDISVKNIGNIVNTKTYRYPVSFFQRLFTKATPAPEVVNIEGKTYLSWNIILNPTEQKSIQVSTNYRPIIYTLFLLLIITLVYFIYRSPVVAKKDVILIGSPEEGISEMKIMLVVRNRSRDIIENIVVTERVPGLAQLVNESYLGTLEPTKILHHDKKGTLIKWEIRTLEPFEERVIAYRIKSKLNILGGIKLPSAKIGFETRKGRERIIYSNRCELDIQ